MTVFSLLAVALVLLVIALATTSPVATLGGVVAYVASVGIYDRHLRKLGRASTPQTRRGPWQ